MAPCLNSCLSNYLSPGLPVCLSPCLSICHLLFPSVFLFLPLSVSVSIHVTYNYCLLCFSLTSIFLSSCFSVSLPSSVSLSLSLSVFLSLCFLLYLFFLSIFLSLCFLLYRFISVCLPVSVSLSHLRLFSMSVYTSPCVSVSPSLPPSLSVINVCVCVFVSVSPSIYVCLPVSVCLSLPLYLNLFPHLPSLDGSFWPLPDILPSASEPQLALWMPTSKPPKPWKLLLPFFSRFPPSLQATESKEAAK